MHIRKAWEAFRVYLESDTPPPLTDQDTKQRTDADWQQAAETYRSFKLAVEEAQAQADEAKAALLKLTTHSREAGFGVSVTKYWKQGNVDYKKVPELQGCDLNLYRGAMREEVRITVG